MNSLILESFFNDLLTRIRLVRVFLPFIELRLLLLLCIPNQEGIVLYVYHTNILT